MVGGDIVFECTYELSSAMAARNVTVGCDRTLHAAECGDMNGISVGWSTLSSRGRIPWRNRVDEKKGAEFCINGFTNHCPDFLAMAVDGAFLAIETGASG